MKRIIISLFLCFQTLFASVQEYKLNDTRVIVCDDFFLPIAKVGVIYPVGLNQLKNICEAEITERIFLSKTTKKSAKKLGIDIDFSIQDNFSEVSATVSHEQISDILRILLTNKPDIKNLQLIKNQIRIKHKLSDYFETNLVSNAIYAGINSRYIFNESISDNICEYELKNSLDKYNKTRMTVIIICGKSHAKQLIEKLHLKQSSFTVDGTFALATYDFSERIIELRSKFSGRYLYRVYQINSPELTEKRNVVFAILSHEIFYYLKTYSQLIDNFFISNLMKPNLFIVGFRLKKDMSEKSFETGLKNFFSLLKKANFSQEKSEAISKLEKFSEIDSDENLDEKYRMIRNQYVLHSQAKKNISDEILKISSEDIKNFTEQVLENGSVAKISVHYKTEN